MYLCFEDFCSTDVSTVKSLWMFVCGALSRAKDYVWPLHKTRYTPTFNAPVLPCLYISGRVCHALLGSVPFWGGVSADCVYLVLPVCQATEYCRLCWHSFALLCVHSGHLCCRAVLARSGRVHHALLESVLFEGAALQITCILYCLYAKQLSIVGSMGVVFFVWMLICVWMIYILLFWCFLVEKWLHQMLVLVPSHFPTPKEVKSDSVLSNSRRKHVHTYAYKRFFFLFILPIVYQCVSSHNKLSSVLIMFAYLFG